MKNKSTMYILLLAVILIWSLIIVRFMSLRNPDNKDIANQPKIVNKKKESTEKTDFLLLLNYADPFFVEKQKNQPQKNVKNNNDIASKKVKSTKSPVTKDQMPTITYSGMISNPTTKKKVGFILTGRKQYLVEAGDHINNLQVINLWNDSIRIKWNEKVIDIKRNDEKNN